MKHLDQQLAAYESELRRDVSLQPDECGKVATLVAADIRFLPSEVKDEIRAASPVPLRARYDELIAFQAWNDFASSIRARPEVTRAQVIVQNYICFGYLKDAGMENLKVLTCGERPFDLCDAQFASPFGMVVDRLAKRYDVVLIDSPPVTFDSAGTSVLVAYPGPTGREQLQSFDLASRKFTGNPVADPVFAGR